MRKKQSKNRACTPQGPAAKIAHDLQLPVGLVDGPARFEMSGNREVSIDGCCSILEYDENVIRLNTGKMVTCFFGRNLNIRCMTPDSMVVEGFITSIEFVT